MHWPVVVSVATGWARVQDSADEYCQDQRTKCDYQREHRLLLSAANGTMEQMPKCGVRRAEPFHSMRTVAAEAYLPPWWTPNLPRRAAAGCLAK